MKDYYLINGSKFGALFLCYTNDPSTTHADSLIFIDGNIVLMNRMATISRKKCVYINPNTLARY